MSTRKFLGIPIEGDAYDYHIRKPVTQRPVEDLKPYFDKLWKNGIKAVYWAQYTPYFNDGDTCEFGVREPSFTTNPEVAKAWLDEDYEEYIEVPRDTANEEGKLFDRELLDTDHYTYERPWSASYPHPDGLTKEMTELPIDAYEFEYAMEESFGDHTEVVVTPDRVIQYEYSHE